MFVRDHRIDEYEMWKHEMTRTFRLIYKRFFIIKKNHADMREKH